jgi:hypothetical protein
MKKEEGRRKKEEGRGKKEEGRGKREEGNITLLLVDYNIKLLRCLVKTIN